MPEIRVPACRLRTTLRRAAIWCALALASASLSVYGAHAEQPALRQLQPEADTGQSDKSLAIGKTFMVSSANALASEAGREILRSGGSAVDAAIAIQLVLGLVEPQSSGLGGGAFLLHWDQAAKSLKTYDGRETAPAAARPDRFLKDGRPIGFETAVHSGLSIGTPGLVRLLEHAHKAHGKLPWADLFAPAIRIAREGFPISNRLYFLLRWFGPTGLSAEAKGYFFDGNGSPFPIGQILKNPAYAATLEAIVKDGAAAFYAGPVAEAVVAAARNAPNAAGDLAASDLAAYKVIERPPVCVPYRSYRICGIGPPSSGGIAVAQILKLIERFDPGRGPDDAMNTAALHLVTEAERLAYADRNRYIADPNFVSVPAGLLDDGYLASRSALIDPAKAMPSAEPGTPPGIDKRAFGIDATLERAGTSHISVVDAQGNAVAMTTTIEGAFGSGMFAAGFLLNNELTDFSFTPTDAAGNAIANRVEGGKRPRSSMAPILVFDDKGEIFASLGSPGGGRIILYVVKTLVALIDWKLDTQAAIDLPNFGSTGDTLELEIGWSTIWKALALKGYGHDISPGLMNSGVHAVVRRNGHLEGGADPRREGAALGD
ncbi:gamma-glutamyltransferase [Hyphomicrobium sp.]|uniref:gamma-glutamyltransferase n=1 Tax=Hyphomicrobium sp. TaxID=82 RepID=UPI003F6E4F8B